METDEALQRLQEKIGCAHRVEIVPKCIDGAIAYRAVIQDEFGVVVGIGSSIAVAVVSLIETFDEDSRGS